MTVVFHGPHAYVSPRWYGRPDEHVPTWNYAVVHAHGRLGAPMDPAALRSLLDDAVAREETGPEGWRTTQLAPDFLDGLARGIVGFAVDIERLEGKFKLSQNRSADDHARVSNALEARGDDDGLAMAALMKTGAPR